MLRSCPGGQVCSVGKRKVAPRKSPNCNNALDNFDVISGASGGYIAATMYCYSTPTASWARTSHPIHLSSPLR